MRSRAIWITACGLPALMLLLLLALPLFAAGRLPTAGQVGGISSRVLTAYQAVDGWCDGLRWELVAGIGFVESGHGTTNGAAIHEDTGEVTPWIFGPPLDGSAGIRRLPIEKWTGWFGLAGPWQQAVGPMQFLPQTFTAWAIDHDGDGVANPHDIDDAAASTANYLCGGTEGAISDERQALLTYNHDESYVAQVLAYADQLSTAASISILCPVAGPTSFSNTWLAPRHGGREHHGVDMFAAEGAPVVAPVSGEVALGEDALGGLSFRLWGDDGNFYYGAHLADFTSVSGQVAAGTMLGYVGRTGNAAGTPPHLHFEIHPGRRQGDPPKPTDPTAIVIEACRS